MYQQNKFSESKVKFRQASNCCKRVLEAAILAYANERSSLSSADLQTVVSARIARAFNRSGATRAVALDISKDFDRVWQAGLLYKRKSYGILG